MSRFITDPKEGRLRHAAALQRLYLERLRIDQSIAKRREVFDLWRAS